MSKDYIPADDQGRVALLERFRDTIGTYAADLGLTPAQLAGQAADAAWARHVVNFTGVIRACSAQWTSYKSLMMTGSSEATAPAIAALPATVPPAVAPGVLDRFRALARLIKAHPSYNPAMGEALGIVTAAAAVPAPGTERPAISLRVSGGQVIVQWTKAGMEALEIQVDRGDGRWVHLATDTRPDYLDATPWPTPPQTWKYRAIYLRDARRIGQWSQVAQITVGG